MQLLSSCIDVFSTQDHVAGDSLLIRGRTTTICEVLEVFLFLNCSKRSKFSCLRLWCRFVCFGVGRCLSRSETIRMPFFFLSRCLESRRFPSRWTWFKHERKSRSIMSPVDHMIFRPSSFPNSPVIGCSLLVFLALTLYTEIPFCKQANSIAFCCSLWFHLPPCDSNQLKFSINKVEHWYFWHNSTISALISAVMAFLIWVIFVVSRSIFPWRNIHFWRLDLGIYRALLNRWSTCLFFSIRWCFSS